MEQPMTERKTDMLAILFADIAKSTTLYETLGDKIAQNLIGRCILLLSEVTLRHQGRVIKTIGDEIMCTVPTANDAVEAAIEMQQSLEDLTIEESPEILPPNIYVGFHFGSVIREAGDVFGDAVNVAARMVEVAKERQIFTTEETVEMLSPEYSENTRCVDKTTIKGKSGEISIYEVIWERQDVTVMLDNSMEAVTHRYRLELRYGSQQLTVDEGRPTATLGRQPHNDIVVNDRRVSRSHARIEYRRGKFFLVDQSTNGTFALVQKKKNISLKRDETQLLGDGVIGLGREADPDDPDLIDYSVKM
jgi:class 3 adenylate cyclase